MNYAETLDYLYTRLPLFSRVGAAAIKPDLHNTEALCAALDHPERKFRSIHVAGTNGKGSVSHMLAAVLQAHGFKTGLYTSPHLHDFRERMRINGSMMPEHAVVDFVERVQPQIEQLEPSFFEITVAMAFDYFAAEQVDIAVIEVGLGGRLDSTNVIWPELCVITNIGYDHMNLLGNTLPEIAAEKAGIIKTDTPVVVGEVLDETIRVFKEKAAAANAALFIAPDHCSVVQHELTGRFLHCTVSDKATGAAIQLKLDLPGIYQLRNICTVWMALQVLQQQGWHFTDEKIKAALSRVKETTGLQGRWDVLRQKPLLVLEVAHNEDGMRQVVSQLAGQQFRRLHVVIGMVKDKDISAVLRLLPENATYYFTNAHIPRAMDAVELKNMAAPFGLNGAAYSHVNDAIDAALSVAAKDDLVLVCGSVFIAGEVDRQRWAAD